MKLGGSTIEEVFAGSELAFSGSPVRQRCRPGGSAKGREERWEGSSKFLLRCHGTGLSSALQGLRDPTRRERCLTLVSLILHPHRRIRGSLVASLAAAAYWPTTTGKQASLVPNSRLRVHRTAAPAHLLYGVVVASISLEEKVWRCSNHSFKPWLVLRRTQTPLRLGVLSRLKI